MQEKVWNKKKNGMVVLVLSVLVYAVGIFVNLQAKCHFFLSKIGTSSTLKTLKIP